MRLCRTTHPHRCTKKHACFINNAKLMFPVASSRQRAFGGVYIVVLMLFIILRLISGQFG